MMDDIDWENVKLRVEELSVFLLVGLILFVWFACIGTLVFPSVTPTWTPIIPTYTVTPTTRHTTEPTNTRLPTETEKPVLLPVVTRKSTLVPTLTRRATVVSSTVTSIPSLAPTTDYQWWNCYVQTWVDYPRAFWSVCARSRDR
jgi:hypothetical protein